MGNSQERTCFPHFCKAFDTATELINKTEMSHKTNNGANSECAVVDDLECNVDLPGETVTLRTHVDIPRGRPKSGRVWKTRRLEP